MLDATWRSMNKEKGGTENREWGSYLLQISKLPFKSTRIKSF